MRRARPELAGVLDDRDRLRAYIEAQGAGALTLAAFDQAFDEYLGKVGHRLGDAKG